MQNGFPEYKLLLLERIGLMVGAVLIPVLVILIAAQIRKGKDISFSAGVDFFVFCITFDLFAAVNHSKLEKLVHVELSTLIVPIYIFFALVGFVSLFWAVCIECGKQRKSNVVFIKRIFQEKKLDIPNKICDYISNNYESPKWKQFVCLSIFVILMSSSLVIIFF